MISQNSSTRATIALGLAVMFLSVSILTSFKRHIRLSDVPQSASNKYQAALNAIYDGHQSNVTHTSAGPETPDVISAGTRSASDKSYDRSCPGFPFQVRPPPSL